MFNLSKLQYLVQNELNTDVARFTTHIKPVFQQIRLLTGLIGVGKMHSITFQLLLLHCCKTSALFGACSTQSFNSRLS